MTGARKTVLVVEDNHVNRRILTRLLENGGYEARTATDGSEALATLEHEPVDAILLDLVMPGIDGMTVLRSLKSNVRHWRIPVIVVSAIEETDSIVQCLELGAEDYLTKPFDPVILRARLDACLARQRFHDLEGEYQSLVEEQAEELERLHAALAAHAAQEEAGKGQGPPAAPHRSEVGVVAVGLGGLGNLVRQLNPGQGLEIVRAFHRTVMASAGRHHAAVAGATPQIVTLVVGGRDAHGDLGETGARLARGCLEDLAPLVDAWNEELGSKVVAGAGVAVGEAILGPIGEPARFGAIGAAVEAAERRCRVELAGDGGVVAGDR